MSKFIEEIKNTDCGNFYLTHKELMDMVDEFGKSVINDSLEMFKAGFIKGQRAEKAKNKIKKRQSLTA